MKPSIRCSLCNDRGFTRVSHGFEECKCRLEKRIESKLIASGIKEVFVRKTLRDFKGLDFGSRDIIKIVEALSKRLAAHEGLPQPVCFFGPRLSGKSLLASILVKSAIKGGYKSRMMGLQAVSDIYFGKDGKYARVEDLITPLDVFCLEVGQEFYGKIMGHLICTIHRYFRESGKVLIYTTPYGREDMAKIYGKDVGEIFKDDLVMIPTLGVPNAV